MLRRPVLASLLTVLAVCAVHPELAHGDNETKGWFGFAVHVESEGFVMNRTVVSVEITSVTPNSPAEKQGLKSGDAVIEVDTLKVAGAASSDLSALMKRSVGESLHLTVRSGDGEPRKITLIAVAKP